MGRSATAFRRSAGDPDWGGLEQGRKGPDCTVGRRSCWPDPPLLADPGRVADHVRKRAVRRPMGRDLRRPLNGTFAAWSP